MVKMLARVKRSCLFGLEKFFYEIGPWSTEKTIGYARKY